MHYSVLYSVPMVPTSAIISNAVTRWRAIARQSSAKRSLHSLNYKIDDFMLFSLCNWWN